MRKGYHKQHNITYNIPIHFIFVTRYRRKIFVGEEIIGEITDSTKQVLDSEGCKLMHLEIGIDHMHLYAGIVPDISTKQLANKIRTETSKAIMAKHPELRGSTVVWGSGCLVATDAIYKKKDCMQFVNAQKKRN